MAHRHKLARMMRGKGGACYAKGGAVKSGKGDVPAGGRGDKAQDDEEKQDGDKAEWKEAPMAHGGKAKMKKHLGSKKKMK